MARPPWTEPELDVFRRFLAFLSDRLQGARDRLIRQGRDAPREPLGAENVVGFGFGLKQTNGVWLPVSAVCAYVVYKRDQRAEDTALAPGWSIDEYVEQARAEFTQQADRDVRHFLGQRVLTDVLEVGTPVLHATRHGVELDNLLLPGGIEIGIENPYYQEHFWDSHDRSRLEGTLGAWLHTAGGYSFLLSCWHCLDPDDAATTQGMRRDVSQPSDPGNPKIAEVIASVRPDPTAQTTVDAAIAVATDRARTTDFLLSIGQITGTVASVSQPTRVRKSGSASMLTSGTAYHPIACPSLPLPDRSGVMVTYNNQIMIATDRPSVDPFSREGDSGALVVDEQNRAVGMIVGGSPGRDSNNRPNGTLISFATPIEAVLNALRPPIESSLGLRFYPE